MTANNVAQSDLIPRPASRRFVSSRLSGVMAMLLPLKTKSKLPHEPLSKQIDEIAKGRT